MTDARNTRAWRALRDQVVTEEPLCRLRFPDICTRVSETADHILTVKQRPDLAMSRANHRGACHACNRARGAAPDAVLAKPVTGGGALSIFD